MKRYIQSKSNNTNIHGWLNRDTEGEYAPYKSAHWEAIAEFDDGTTLEFTRPVTVKGWQAENDQQYDIECDLLDRATATGKEVVFYTVNFVCDD